MGSIALDLRHHPTTPSKHVERIEVCLERKADGAMWLRYHVEAPSCEIMLPNPAEPARQNELWQATCFELFVRHPAAADYIEFNFSPSTRWAAYHFGAYRLDIEDQHMALAPDIYLDASEGHVALEVELILPAVWHAAALELALSAVLEEAGGTKSYWALKHPPGPPDFHHPDCFALTLPAPEAL